MAFLIGQSLGRYHILEQLGEGGMATVYKAYDTRLEREVALKAIRVNQFAPNVLDHLLKRFDREAKALARLTHANIVHVIDYGEHESIPYLVMDYLPGGTLKQRLGRPIPWREAVRLLLPIAEALDYAHSRGVVHRDVKPANILMSQNGQPMLSDFGIAKLLESEESHTMTGTGMGLGTPGYMAPEQIDGRGVDGRADIYSLGVVLFELITAHKPFQADTPMAVMIMQVRDPLPRPGTYISGLPDAVEQMLLKALAKDPQDRHPTMGDLVKAMERLLAARDIDLPVQVRSSIQELDETLADFQPVGTDKAIPPPGELKIRKGETHGSQIKVTKRIPNWMSGLAGMVGVGLVVVLIVLLGQIDPGGQVDLVPSAVKTITQVTPSETNLMEITPESLSPTSTIKPSITPTPDLEIGSNWVRPIDGMVMVFVPSGEFLLGSTESDYGAQANEKPQHTVFLDAYWIDRTEVTNETYARCVKEEACQPPAYISSNSQLTYYDNPQFANYPVIYVDWLAANAYCSWAGGYLPSEAQWEKAARGKDGGIYPWGNEEPNSDLANYRGNDTSAVGSYPAGASPYGALDMTGNVGEWVADWYSETYYSKSLPSNPKGPVTGTYRIIRGSAWSIWDGFGNRSAGRMRFFSTEVDYAVGFRCAGDTPPSGPFTNIPITDPELVPTQVFLVYPAEIPKLISPGNGRTTVGYYPMSFQWYKSANAVQYKVEMWGGDSGPIILCNWQSSTYCNIEINKLTPGTYFWHVKARNKVFEESDWSETYYFSVND